MTDKNEGERRINAILMKEALDRNNDLTKEIHGMLMGNGGPGILTRLALHAKSIKIQWWFIGAIALSILSSAAWVVKAGLTK